MVAIQRPEHNKEDNWMLRKWRESVTRIVNELLIGGGGGGGGGGSVSDAAYSGSWNGDTTNAPSKNAVYDKIELMMPLITAWHYYASQWSVEPVEVGVSTISSQPGTVWEYELDSVTRYRFVPDTYDATLDGFYSSYSSPTLSGLIVTRG